MDLLGIQVNISLEWMPKDFIDGNSRLIQVMVWCRQAASHYLSPCCPKSVPPYGVTKAQWVKMSECNYPPPSWTWYISLQRRRLGLRSSVITCVWLPRYNRPRRGQHATGPPSLLMSPVSHSAVLTHLPLDKMAAILQTIFSDAFSWMKNFVFQIKFHWSLFLRVHFTVTQHWFRSGLGAE